MFAPSRTLIVEDEAMIALHIEATLADLGHEAQCAATVREAEAILADGGITFAILDYHLQGETTAALANQLQSRGIPSSSARARADSTLWVMSRPTRSSSPSRSRPRTSSTP